MNVNLFFVVLLIMLVTFGRTTWLQHQGQRGGPLLQAKVVGRALRAVGDARRCQQSHGQGVITRRTIVDVSARGCGRWQVALCKEYGEYGCEYDWMTSVRPVAEGSVSRKCKTPF